MTDLTQTTLKFIPPCDLPHPMQAKPDAYADASLPNHGGSWAYVCEEHFNQHGCNLGLGKGQELIKDNS